MAIPLIGAAVGLLKGAGAAKAGGGLLGGLLGKAGGGGLLGKAGNLLGGLFGGKKKKKVAQTLNPFQLLNLAKPNPATMGGIGLPGSSLLGKLLA